MASRSYKLEKEESEAKLCGVCTKLPKCVYWSVKVYFWYTENLLPSTFKSS